MLALFFGLVPMSGYTISYDEDCKMPSKEDLESMTFKKWRNYCPPMSFKIIDEVTGKKGRYIIKLKEDFKIADGFIAPVGTEFYLEYSSYRGLKLPKDVEMRGVKIDSSFLVKLTRDGELFSFKTK